jgi:hypothetical protein
MAVVRGTSIALKNLDRFHFLIKDVNYNYIYKEVLAILVPFFVGEILLGKL